MWTEDDCVLLHVHVALPTKLLHDHHRLRQVVKHAVGHPRLKRFFQGPVLLIYHSSDIGVPQEVVLVIYGRWFLIIGGPKSPHSGRFDTFAILTKLNDNDNDNDLS